MNSALVHRSGTPWPSNEFIMTLDCPDTPGIVHTVSGFILQHSGNILESQQFDYRSQNRFFMRVHFECHARNVTPDALIHDFEPVADRFSMNWQLVKAASRTRTLVLVSQFGHCLNDLLYRSQTSSLQVDIAGVMSNHRQSEQLVKSYGVPFHHVPVSTDTKAEAEETLLRLVDELDVDLVVLARYMQILSDDLCKTLEGRMINIHHSFLPSFKGAKPYHQAHDRGVKLIGATAHYITPDLDQGPIIEQDVARVNHSYTPDELIAVGRDIECQVLARAVKWHSEHRIFLNQNNTVVLQ